MTGWYCLPGGRELVGPVRLDAVDVAEDPAVVAGVGVLPGLAVGRERRAARAGHGARFEERAEVARVATEQHVGQEQDRRRCAAATDGEAAPPAHTAAVGDLARIELGTWVECHGDRLVTGTEARIVASGRRTAARGHRCSRPRNRIARPDMDIRPCRVRDEWQVRRRPSRTYRLVIANGPPDIETFDRRRVDPPAGCRAAAEPAHLPQRRSVDDPPSSAGRRWRAAARGTLVAQEALDVGDEVVARRQPLLVVHRLEPLDVAARRLVEAGCRVEPGRAARAPPRPARGPGSRPRGACPSARSSSRAAVAYGPDT